MMKSVLAPIPLADESLTAVAGAKRGRRGPKLSFRNSPVTNTQSNTSGAIVQIALGNEGDVSQGAYVEQSNSISF
jgi:hypothetical protein